jgi:SNF2 family DNA or RNA helicase
MTYVPVLPPYAHQIAALAKAEGKSSFAYLMGMRTGKTKTTIDEWGRMVDAGETRDLLVLAPAGVYLTWEAELKKHLPPDILDKTIKMSWVSGAGALKSRMLEAFLINEDQRRPRVFLVNIEALSTVQKAREACLAFLASRQAEVVIDESTIIKDVGSKRTQFVLDKIKPLARYRRILSGLPSPKSPLDLWAQFEFLDNKILKAEIFHHFKARHAITQRITLSEDNRKIDIVVGYRNVEEIYGRIEPHSSRVRLQDCYDVPKKEYITRHVDHTPEQKRIYQELKDFANAEIRDGNYVTATRAVTRMLRLHQLNCGHLVDDDGIKQSVAENRTKALVDILRDYDGKAVIWCSYDYDVNKIVDALRKEFGENCLARFWGGNRSTREAEEARFKEDVSCLYMVATPAAGGRGRTWAGAADLVIYFSNSDNLEHREQSEERTQGMDKDRPVTYIDFIVPGTVDEKIVKSMRKKMDLAAMVMGEDPREWIV